MSMEQKTPKQPLQHSGNSLLLFFGTVTLLAVIFLVPAVLVPFVMTDVPDRAMTKVLSLHQQSVWLVERTFQKHHAESRPGRLATLPQETKDWIELINPMGRKAPGGGLAVKTIPDANTGAIGLSGDQSEVRITVPAYRDLKAVTVTIRADGS